MAPVSALLVMLRKLAKSSRPQPCWFALKSMRSTSRAFHSASLIRTLSSPVTESKRISRRYGFWRYCRPSGLQASCGWRPELCGCAGHTAVGQQCHLKPRSCRMPKGRVVCATRAYRWRGPVADNADKIAFNSPRSNAAQHFALVVEHDGRRFDDAGSRTADTLITPRPMLPFIRRRPPSGENGLSALQDVFIAAGFGASRHSSLPSAEERLFV